LFFTPWLKVFLRKLLRGKLMISLEILQGKLL